MLKIFLLIVFLCTYLHFIINRETQLKRIGASLRDLKRKIGLNSTTQSLEILPVSNKLNFISEKKFSIVTQPTILTSYIHTESIHNEKRNPSYQKRQIIHPTNVLTKQESISEVIQEKPSIVTQRTKTEQIVPSPYNHTENIHNFKGNAYNFSPTKEIIQPTTESSQQKLIFDIEPSNIEDVIQENVETPLYSLKPWTDEYVNIIENVVKICKAAAEDYDVLKNQFKSYKIPLLEDYFNPEALTLERNGKIMSGGYGDIFTLKNYPNEYVEKKISIMADVHSEIKMGIYASYCNPNLFVGHYGRFGKEKRSILLEKCETDLKEYMNKIKGDRLIRMKKYREGLIALTKFLPKVLQELKNLGIVHFDIKNENILMCNGSLKLGDFGAARLRSERVTQRGTHGFESPLQSQGIFDENADKYAAGKTLLELLHYVTTSKYSKPDSKDPNHFPPPRIHLRTDDAAGREFNQKRKIQIDDVVDKIRPGVIEMNEYDIRENIRDLLYDYLRI